MSLLKVENLSVGFRSGKKCVPVIDHLSFSLEKGEILALVGESGCGKSASSLALTRLLPDYAEIRAEHALFEGRNGTVELLQLPSRSLRKIRGGGIAYIFQEPQSSLNPVFRIGDQIAEVLALHRPEVRNRKAEILRLLESVGIPDPAARINSFPHELSGGMQQRIMIAMALAGKPELLIADEPTTALDVTIQAQIIEVIDQLRRESGTAVILITHNFGVVAQLADRVAVMYAGHIVECAFTDELIHHPKHPYTQALIAAVPDLAKAEGKLSTIPGQVPTPDKFPKGCRFCGRCAACTPELKLRCEAEIPPATELSPGHQCSCFLYESSGK